MIMADIRKRAAVPAAEALELALQTSIDSPHAVSVARPWASPAAKGSGRAQQRTCFTADSVMSEEECCKLIEISEASGYDKALVNVGGGRQVLMTDVRSSSRCIIDSVGAATILWERLRHLIPPEVVPGVATRWRAVGLNERLRFLRYSPGDYFAPHCDGCYVREEAGPRHGQRSYMTWCVAATAAPPATCTPLRHLSAQLMRLARRAWQHAIPEHT